MNVKKLLCLCCLWPLLACEGASIRMFTGESYEGKVDFDADGMTVTPEHGTATKVDLAGVQDALFGATPNNFEARSPAGVFLTNGSFIAGAVTAIDGPAVKVGALGISVPCSAFAQVLFVPMARDKLPPPAGGRTGAILPNGDFFPGTVDGMKANRLAVNSILFGPQRLAPGSQAAGAVLRDIQSVAASYEVSTREGSRFLTNDLKFDAAGVLVADSIVGSVRIKTDDLVEIRAGAWRYQSLAEATPARIQVPAGMTTAAAFQVEPANPAAADAAPALLCAANTMVSYLVPAGFSVFVSSVALPKNAPANAQLIFDIYADGRLIFGSPVVSAGGNPHPIRVSLGAARLITLRAEPAGIGSEKTAGKWIYPLFLRNF